MVDTFIWVRREQAACLNWVVLFQLKNVLKKFVVKYNANEQKKLEEKKRQQQIQEAKKLMASFFKEKLKYYDTQVNIRRYLYENIQRVSEPLQTQLSLYLEMKQQLVFRFDHAKKFIIKELNQYNSQMLKGVIIQHLQSCKVEQFKEVLEEIDRITNTEFLNAIQNEEVKGQNLDVFKFETKT